MICRTIWSTASVQYSVSTLATTFSALVSSFPTTFGSVVERTAVHQRKSSPKSMLLLLNRPTSPLLTSRLVPRKPMLNFAQRHMSLQLLIFNPRCLSLLRGTRTTTGAFTTTRLFLSTLDSITLTSTPSPGKMMSQTTVSLDLRLTTLFLRSDLLATIFCHSVLPTPVVSTRST